MALHHGGGGGGGGSSAASTAKAAKSHQIQSNIVKTMIFISVCYILCDLPMNIYLLILNICTRCTRYWILSIPTHIGYGRAFYALARLALDILCDSRFFNSNPTLYSFFFKIYFTKSEIIALLLLLLSVSLYLPMSAKTTTLFIGARLALDIPCDSRILNFYAKFLRSSFYYDYCRYHLF